LKKGGGNCAYGPMPRAQKQPTEGSEEKGSKGRRFWGAGGNGKVKARGKIKANL